MTSIFILVNSLGIGGTEYIVSTLSLGLAKDMECQVITISDGNKVAFPVNKPVISLCHPKSSLPAFIKIPLYGCKLFFNYISLVHKYHPDVVLSTHPETNVLNLLTCKLLNVKSIISIHEQPNYFEGMSRVHYYCRRLVCRLSKKHANQIITVSQGLKDTLIADFSVPESKIMAIWNPVSLNNIEMKMDENLNDSFFISDMPILISVGNPSHVKGQWHLIRVLFEINKIFPCKLVICGSGSLSPYLSSMVDYYHLNELVNFSGKVDNVFKYLKNSTCFVLSSLSEGFGIVLVEAMACGCPIVSSNCPYGPNEILDGGKYGLLCESQGADYPDWDSPLTSSEQDMMDKIIMMLTDDALRNAFAENGKERAKMFDSDITINKYLNLIFQLD